MEGEIRHRAATRHHHLSKRRRQHPVLLRAQKDTPHTAAAHAPPQRRARPHQDASNATAIPRPPPSRKRHPQAPRHGSIRSQKAQGVAHVFQ